MLSRDSHRGLDFSNLFKFAGRLIEHGEHHPCGGLAVISSLFVMRCLNEALGES